MIRRLLTRWLHLPAEKETERNVRWTTGVIVILLAGGIVCLWTFALGTTAFWATFSLSTLIGLGAMASGGLLGFLFGVPRSSAGTSESGAHPEQPIVAGGNTTLDEHQPRRYFPNSNLELVSDWLTKILVGIGLTQYQELRAEFIGITTLLATGIYEIAQNDSTPSMSLAQAQTLVSATIVYFLVAGFLAVYLLTRLFLSGALSVAENQLYEEEEAAANVAATVLPSPLAAQAPSR